MLLLQARRAHPCKGVRRYPTRLSVDTWTHGFLAAGWRAGTPAGLLCLGATCLQALEPCVASLDLLLRWCVLRLADGNTQTLVSVTSMLKVRCAGSGAALHRCVGPVCCAATPLVVPLPSCVAVVFVGMYVYRPCLTCWLPTATA